MNDKWYVSLCHLTVMKQDSLERERRRWFDEWKQFFLRVKVSRQNESRLPLKEVVLSALPLGLLASLQPSVPRHEKSPGNEKVTFSNSLDCDVIGWDRLVGLEWLDFSCMCSSKYLLEEFRRRSPITRILIFTLNKYGLKVSITSYCSSV